MISLQIATAKSWRPKKTKSRALPGFLLVPPTDVD
jgi:hypothetical protein